MPMPSISPDRQPSRYERVFDGSSCRLTPTEADELITTLRDFCGLSISPDKRPFIELRVGRRLRALRIDNFQSYLARLRGAEGADERQSLAESLVTHTTGFFREGAHFDWLQSHGLPSLAEAGVGRTRELVIWSAACSIGSELWSAGFVVDRKSRTSLGRLQWRLVGTDLSRQALRRAAAATYSTDEISGLPEDYRKEYLLRSKGQTAGGTLFRVAPAIRQRATFQQVNLVRPETSASIEADIIFLRNVLIYFDQSEQVRVIKTLTQRLRRGGFLLTGHSENLVHPPAGMIPVLPSIYRKD